MLIRNKYNGYSKDGIRIYRFDSGGGPAQSTTASSELPEWAREYAKDALARGQALTSQPYQTYTGGERIAGFSDLQQQAQKGIAGMTTAPQLGQASGLAGFLGSQAFGAGQYAPGQFTGGTFGTEQAQQYMSPYLEQALAPQLREAQRSSDILGMQQAGQAVQRGAFGGSRAGLLEAERQRNLGTQMGDIRARGYQSAFENAQQQYNQDMARRMQAQQLGEQSRQFGAGLGMQGLGMGLQAAGLMGQLGQQQFQQQKDIYGMQKQTGAEQQALEQQRLSQNYQDFLNQQNYPYKQLGFMSDMIRGLPLGQQSAQQIYAGQPTALQTMGSLGLGAYGLKQLGMFADGGSVNSEEFVADTLDSLSDMQLAQAERAAVMRNDVKRLGLIAEEKAMRASERGGLAGAFNQIPQQSQQQMVRAANGGIIAFSRGGANDGIGIPTSEEDVADWKGLFEPELYGRDSAAAGPEGVRQSVDSAADVRGLPKTAAQYLAEGQGTYEVPTALQQQTGIMGQRKFLEAMAGPSALTPFVQDLAEERKRLGEQREQNKGLIALAGARALSTPGGLRRGISEFFGAIGSEAGKLDQQMRQANRDLRQSQISLATAEQARKDGFTGKAVDLETKAEELRRKAFEERRDAALKAAQIQAGFEQAQLSGAKAVEAARISAGKPTDLQNLSDKYLRQAVAKNPAIAKDPVLLADAEAEAGARAANDLGRKPGSDVLDNQMAIARMRMQHEAATGAMKTLALNADYLTLAAKRDPESRAKATKMLEDETRRQYDAIAAASGLAPGARAGAGARADDDLMKVNAIEWLRNNPNHPKAAEVRARLGM